MKSSFLLVPSPQRAKVLNYQNSHKTRKIHLFPSNFIFDSDFWLYCGLCIIYDLITEWSPRLSSMSAYPNIFCQTWISSSPIMVYNFGMFSYISLNFFYPNRFDSNTSLAYGWKVESHVRWKHYHVDQNNKSKF